MKLYLVRHGEPMQSGSLSEKGKEDTKKVAITLKKKHIGIDAIFYSVKLRAKQTAIIIHNIAATSATLVEKEGLAPTDPIEPIVEEIHGFDQTTMLVGHLPFMEKLMMTLLADNPPFLFQTSCVACLEKKEDCWSLLWTTSPR